MRVLMNALALSLSFPLARARALALSLARSCARSRALPQIAERRAYTQKMLFPEKFKPKLEAASKSKALDLTDELDEEERLRVEAAEWMPSTFTTLAKESPDALEDKLGSAFERIKKTVQV